MLIIADLMKEYSSISPRLEEDYHSIKDDIPLVSAYTMRNVNVRGILIQDALLINEIHSSDDYKEYETVFVNVAIPMNPSKLGKKKKQSAGETSSPKKSLKVTIKQKPKTTSIPPPSDDRERDKIAEATLLLQEKLAKGEIEKMVEGEEDDESYVSVFADSMLNDDVDDSDTRIQPRSHKENPKVVEDDDDLNAIKMKDGEKKDDNDEKVDDAEEKDNDDQTDHALVEPQAKGSIITPHVLGSLTSSINSQCIFCIIRVCF
ncbi:hypothetical protein Tco_0431031 [Tanacetum coccineum]